MRPLLIAFLLLGLGGALTSPALCWAQTEGDPLSELADQGRDPDLAAEIRRRVEIDQRVRTAWIEFLNSSAGDPNREQEGARLADEVARVDEDNRAWLKALVADRGWPGTSLVGPTSSQGAWLLVQHADADLAFQKDCLERMKAAEQGEVNPINIAYLTDRVLVAENQPQIYGTQCHEVDGEFQPRPCLEPERLNARRQTVGLPPIEDYLAQIRALYKPQPTPSSVLPPLPQLPGGAEGLEALSLRQIPLRRTLASDLPAEFLSAERDYQADPTQVETAIWYGRRLAYLGRFREAIQIYSDALQRSPLEPRLYRHRGHRWITLRQFQLARLDLSKAADLIADQPDPIEPDGQPNSAGIPTSTLHTNIWYHLGLAHFLLEDYAAAREAYARCLAASQSEEMRVATRYWYYLTLRRLGQNETAAELIADVPSDLHLLENQAYYRLLLLFRGQITANQLREGQADWSPVDRSTYGFGLAQHYAFTGQLAASRQELENVVATTDQPGTHWAAFGLIAAEADLIR